jgi:MFS family permease
MGWMSDLEPKERRTLGACFGGWALDSFDVNIYGLAIPSLLTVLHFTMAEAGMLATVALLLSAVGGWVTGMLSDRYGRVRILQWTILWFAFFTFLSGFTQNFNQLFICRALQGLGFGGEWAAGAVLIGETTRDPYRGRAVGTVQSGWAIGWAAATLLFWGVFSLLPEALAWRVMFWFGLAPALLVFYIRRFVPEPELHQHAAPAHGSPLSQLMVVFRPGVLPLIIITSLLTTGAQGGYYAVTTWLPTFLRTERNLTVMGTSGYLLVLIAGAFSGYLAAAHMADRFGRKPTFLVFGLGAGAIVGLYMLLPISDALMLVLGFPLGFFSSGVFSPMGAFLAELFPTEIRGTAQGFAYNFGRAVGALFPTMIGYLSAKAGLGVAIGIFTVGAYALLPLALLMLPETRGRSLADVALQAGTATGTLRGETRGEARR